MDTERVLTNLTESELIDLAGQRGGLKMALQEFNRRRFGLINNEIQSFDALAHAKSIETTMSMLGRGVRRKTCGE